MSESTKLWITVFILVGVGMGALFTTARRPPLAAPIVISTCTSTVDSLLLVAVARHDSLEAGKLAVEALQRHAQGLQRKYDSLRKAGRVDGSAKITWAKLTVDTAPSSYVISTTAREPHKTTMMTRRHGEVDLDDLLDDIDEVLEVREELP